MHQKHAGHAEMHAEMIFILLIVLLLSQVVLIQWRKHRPYSYHLCTLIGIYPLSLPTLNGITGSWNKGKGGTTSTPKMIEFQYLSKMFFILIIWPNFLLFFRPDIRPMKPGTRYKRAGYPEQPWLPLYQNSDIYQIQECG